jgi:carbonic anhydrase/acetyltransferase-like protein (isoleucine patch superfamily)
VPLYGYRGKRPTVAPDAFIAPTAVLIGDVTVRSGASVWFGSVLRGDMDRIEIGEVRTCRTTGTIHTDTGEADDHRARVHHRSRAIVHSSVVRAVTC